MMPRDSIAIIALMTLILLGMSQAAWANPRLAVLPFEVDSPDPDHAVLGSGIANMLVTDLSRTSRIEVVERTRLVAILGELDLQRSGRVDEATAVDVGRLAGATSVLTGGITEANGMLRIDARLISVETGAVHDVATAQGRSEDFFLVFEDLTRDLLEEFDGGVDAQDERVLERRDGGTLESAVSYGEAVDAWDAGDVKASRAAVATSARGAAVSKERIRAEIEPLPPFFLMAGFNASVPIRVERPKLGYSFSFGGGWNLDEILFLSGQFARGLISTDPGPTTTSLVEVTARLRALRLGPSSVLISASAGAGLPLDGLSGLSPQGGLGVDLMLVQHEKTGGLIGLHAVGTRLALRDQTPTLWTGLELRLTAIAFGGVRR